MNGRSQIEMCNKACALQEVELYRLSDLGTIAAVKFMIVSIENPIVHVNSLGRLLISSEGHYKSKKENR